MVHRIELNILFSLYVPFFIQLNSVKDMYCKVGHYTRAIFKKTKRGPGHMAIPGIDKDWPGRQRLVTNRSYPGRVRVGSN
jgi:hypothetical protein